MSYYDIVRKLLDTQPTTYWPPILCSSDKEPSHLLTAGGLLIDPGDKVTELIIPWGIEGIDPYNEAKEVDVDIIFKLDDWQIEGYISNPLGPMDPEVDWISHYCKVYGWRYRIGQWELMADGCCPQCCEMVPEEIMGVWKLKNFNNKEGEAAARELTSVTVYAKSNEPEETSEW
jgi:hypothetical protein